MRTGVDVLPDFMKDTSDRNRTSPFAFTGNKFEFRALGSSLNIACPNYMLNTMVAEELSEFYDELKDADDMDAAIKALVKKVFTEHQNIIFNGNNYAPEWLKRLKEEDFLTSSHFLTQWNTSLTRRILTSLLRIRFVRQTKSVQDMKLSLKAILSRLTLRLSQ